MEDEHARDGPVKDAAQDVAEDVTQNVAGDVLGAAEDGSAMVLVVACVIFHRPLRFPWATHEGQARQGRGAGRCGGRATGSGAGIDLWGPGGARPHRLATTAIAGVFAQLALR